MTKPPSDPRRRRLEERLRAEFIKGALREDSQRRLGWPLTREELERVLRRFPSG